MGHYTLAIPEEVYLQANQIAEETSRSVEQVMIEHLKTLSPPLPALPPEEQEELDALRHLSDDALWTIAREQMPIELQERMQHLMEQNSSGDLSNGEYEELEQLVTRGNQLMVRKAEAAALLIERGYSFTQTDFGPLNE